MLPRQRKVTGVSCLVAITVILSSLSLSAQDSPNYLEEIVVTSSGIPVPRRTIGTSVVLVTREEITDYGNVSVVDILRQQSAVAATVSGGPGKTTALRIRGEEGFRTLAIFDGIRLSDPSAPQVTPLFEHMLSSGIGRLEILKGPQGLSYGADAGGVINLQSPRMSNGNEIELAAETGEFGTRHVNASTGGSHGAWDYYLSGSDFATEGYNVQAADNLLKDDDGYENTTLHGRLGWSLGDSLHLELVHRDVAGESEYDNCFAGVTGHDCLSEYDLSATRLALSYSGDNLNQALSYASSGTDRRELADDVFQFGNEGQLDRWEYMGSLAGLGAFDLVFGADWEEAEADGISRNNIGIYVQYLSDFSERLFLNIGARHDDNDDFGTHTSLRSSLAYVIPVSVGYELKLKTSYGTGFRAPSLFEVAYNHGPFAFPPASATDLTQEESRGWEGGIELATDAGFYVEAVYFEQEIDNAIEFDLAGFSGYLQETGRSESRGLELSAEVPIRAGLSLQGNYTYNDTERPDGRQRLRRPVHLWNLGLAYRGLQDRLRFNLFYRAARDAVDEVFGSVLALSGYNVLDLSARYRVTDNAELYLRVENAGNDQYEQVSGFFSPDRAAYAGIRLQF